MGASLVAQTVKHLPTMRKTWVRSLGWEFPLEKEMAPHSSTLTWKIPWMEGFQSSKSERESEIAQSCPTLCNPMDCSLLGSSVDGIFRAKVLEWVAISFSNA